MHHITTVVYQDHRKTPSAQDYEAVIQAIEQFLKNSSAIENLGNSVRQNFDLSKQSSDWFAAYAERSFVVLLWVIRFKFEFNSMRLS